MLSDYRTHAQNGASNEKVEIRRARKVPDRNRMKGYSLINMDDNADMNTSWALSLLGGVFCPCGDSSVSGEELLGGVAELLLGTRVAGLVLFDELV